MYYGNSSYYHDYLIHYGVKGMKWGVRRAKKKEAKLQYRKAKADARNKRYAAEEKADAEYEKAMYKQNRGLKKVDEEYAAKQKTIDAHYEKEIGERQKKVDSAKDDMDFWGEDSMWYKDSADKYERYSKELSDTQSRYDAATLANQIARDQAAIKVRDLNYKTSEKAEATREAAYTKAGAEYVESVSLAKMTYKDAKRRIKNS